MLLDFVFPDHCLSCGRPLPSGSRHLCDGCLALLRPRVRDVPLPAAGDCSPGTPRRVHYVYEFDGPMRAAMHALKYGRTPSVATLIAREAASELAACEGFRSRVLVPVPLHAVRRRERGYNQAELLAGPIAARLGLPVVAGAVRVRPTRSQARLDRAGRARNVRDAFRGVRSAVAGRRVLLVDDVVTTGATMIAVASALLVAGATSIACLAVASAPPPVEASAATAPPEAG